MSVASLVRNIVLGFGLTLGVIALIVLGVAVINGDKPCTGSSIQKVAGCKSK